MEITLYTVYAGQMRLEGSDGDGAWRFRRADGGASFLDKRDALVCFAERKGNLRSDFLMEGMRKGNFRRLMEKAGLGVQLWRETYEVVYDGDGEVSLDGCGIPKERSYAGGEVLHAASYTYDNWIREFGDE